MNEALVFEVTQERLPPFVRELDALWGILPTVYKWDKKLYYELSKKYPVKREAAPYRKLIDTLVRRELNLLGSHHQVNHTTLNVLLKELKERIMTTTNEEIIKGLGEAGVPVLLVGYPGVGKTEIVKSLFGYTEILLLSAESEESLSGLPFREGNYDYRTIPAMFRRLEEADKQGKTTCLFLDELDKARRSVADSILSLISSRKIGEATLPSKTVIVAACNPPEAGGADGISQPMLNRFTSVKLEPNVPSWIAWAKERYGGTLASKVIECIAQNEFPICEITGEGLDMRVTSPRSLELAMKAINALGVSNPKAIEVSLKGLLTPNAVGKIYNSLDFTKEIKETLRNVKRTLASVQQQTNKVKEPFPSGSWGLTTPRTPWYEED